MKEIYKCGFKKKRKGKMNCVVNAELRGKIIKRITISEASTTQEIVNVLSSVSAENQWHTKDVYFNIESLNGYKPSKIFSKSINDRVRAKTKKRK